MFKFRSKPIDSFDFAALVHCGCVGFQLQRGAWLVISAVLFCVHVG